MQENQSQMSPADLAELERAQAALERDSLAAQFSALLGRQFATLGRLLPGPARYVVNAAASAALKAAMRTALSSLGKGGPRPESRALHRILAAASGAAGGAAGFVALPLELPVSTTILLRSIADIARAEGEDLSRPEAVLECLEVFALSGAAPGADPIDGGYFALRALFSKTVSEAAAYVAQRSAVDETAPILVRLIGMISARFGVIVSQKALAQAVPVIGAVSGAAINLAFAEHYQALAKAHFTIRRLERKYSQPTVRKEFERIATEKRLSAPVDSQKPDAPAQ